MRLVFLLFVLITTYSLARARQTDDKNILLLNSYHAGFQWTDDLTKGVRDAIEPQSENKLFVEYLDSKRFNDSKYFNELIKTFSYKYDKTSIDGIICADDYAFEFFLDHGDSIWDKNIPATFCGINHINNYKYDTKRIKGIKENIDVRRTLSLINSLEPNTDSLIIISDYTFSGYSFLSCFWDEWQQSQTQIPFKIIDGSNCSELRSNLERISPKNKAIILLSLYLEKEGIPVDMKTIGPDLFKDIDIPIYSFWDYLIGNFIVGGSVLCAHDQGHHAAQMLLQRIDDPHIQFPDVMAADYHITVDYNMLKKYKLDDNLLPNDTHFVNKETPFYVRYNKQLIYFLLTLAILITIIFLLSTNIVRRKSVEKKLLENEERLDLALTGADQGMWDIDMQLQKIIYSDNFARLLGYQYKQELNIDLTNWQKLFKNEDIPLLKQAFLLHIRGIEPIFSFESPMYMKNGSLRYFSITGKITEQHIKDDAMRMTGVIKDISSQKEFESQLKIAKDKAEESDRLKSSFLANMSHEIRTPMNAILGFSDILMSQDVNTIETKDYLSQIKNSGENLLNIINDIVDFSKIESGLLPIRKERFDLSILLNNVIHAGKTLIKRRNKSITLSLDKETANSSAYIYSDPFRLEQILLNLISNAVKYTDEGGIVLKYVTGPNTLLTFMVSDTGQGISPEDQHIIFERFRQADNSSNMLHSGTGLGLSITRSLVQMLGGTVWVESELNKGSTFSFTIQT